MSLQQDIKQPYIGNIVELWEIGFSQFSGDPSDIIRISPHISQQTFWRGLLYDPFPIESSSPEKDLNRAPSRINLRISNVNKSIFLKAQQYGDLIGANVTRWRTLSKYLDGEPEADPNEHWPIERYEIIQLSQFSRESIEFILANKLNLPNVKLPLRQCMKDDIPGQLLTPGVGLNGISRR